MHQIFGTHILLEDMYGWLSHAKKCATWVHKVLKILTMSRKKWVKMFNIQKLKTHMDTNILNEACNMTLGNPTTSRHKGGCSSNPKDDLALRSKQTIRCGVVSVLGHNKLNCPLAINYHSALDNVNGQPMAIEEKDIFSNNNDLTCH